MKEKKWVENHLTYLDYKNAARTDRRDNFEKLIRYYFGEDLCELNEKGAQITGVEIFTNDVNA